MKTVCINNKNKPNEIPNSMWVVEGREYTIIDVAWMETQNKWGVLIAEIDLRPFYPWKYFAYDRFALTADDISRFIAKKKEEEQAKKTEKVKVEELEEEYA